MAAYSVVGELSEFAVRARSDVDVVTISTDRVTGGLNLEMDGDGRLDLNAPVTAQIEIGVRGLSSGNLIYDRELQRRLDGRRHPVIRIGLLAVEPAGSMGTYRVSGEVSYRGRVRAYTAEMLVGRPGADLVRAEGRHDVDMRDFGVDLPRFLMLKVHPVMQVTLRAVARLQR